MKKRILLIGYNFYPEPTGIGKYSGEMLRWLAERGHDCTALTTYPYYPHWKVQEPYTQRRFWYTTEQEQFASGGRLVVARCPAYVPAQPSGAKRILLDFSFLVSAAAKLVGLMGGRKFDIVLVVAPSFQFGLLGVLYKQLRHAKLGYHIQDMQIEAARDLQMITSPKLINLLFKVEHYIFAKSDLISSISEGMVAKIRQKAAKDVLLFPNWTDTAAFRPLPNRAALKEEFGFKATDKVILYAGAIGEKQGLEAIIRAATAFQQRPGVVFAICGSGPYKAKLQAEAATLRLTNVVFLPLQPLEKFNRFLNSADVHLVIQKANASDLVMPSKLTTILAVGGLALITADAQSGLHSLVQRHNMGLLVAAENQPALNAGIEQAITTDNSALGNNARAYAENYLAQDSVMQSFEQALLLL